MAEDTGANAALDRLDRAFARVEAAAHRLRQAPASAELEARHQRLQAEVKSALDGIDRLIAAADGR